MKRLEYVRLNAFLTRILTSRFRLIISQESISRTIVENRETQAYVRHRRRTMMAPIFCEKIMLGNANQITRGESMLPADRKVYTYIYR